MSRPAGLGRLHAVGGIIVRTAQKSIPQPARFGTGSVASIREAEMEEQHTVGGFEDQIGPTERVELVLGNGDTPGDSWDNHRGDVPKRGVDDPLLTVINLESESGAGTANLTEFHQQVRPKSGAKFCF